MRLLVLSAAVGSLALAACTTTDPYSSTPRRNNTGTGVLTGALAGAALGYLTNTNNSEEGRKNALIGAGIGALAGGAVGSYMDSQENELRAQLEGTGVSVTRAGNQIILNMPSNITFATDQDAVKPGFYQTLNSVALVLKKFNRTTVDVYGHTDSTGGDQYNFDLSQRRAMSVANYLSAQGVDQRRFAVTGFGKTRPIATNATEAGRAQNRRVEIQLSPLT